MTSNENDILDSFCSKLAKIINEQPNKERSDFAFMYGMKEVFKLLGTEDNS
jgi:hypothetical protein